MELLLQDGLANLFADKGEAEAQFHEEFTQIAQQAGLQVSLAVTLR